MSTRADSLHWDDVLSVLETVDTIDELRTAMSSPEQFFVDVTNSLGPATFKLVLAKLRPKIEPFILRHDITWDVRRHEASLPSLTHLRRHSRRRPRRCSNCHPLRCPNLRRLASRSLSFA